MDANLGLFLAVAIVGLGKGGLGGPAVGSMILPILIQSMTVQAAVGVTLILLLVSDGFAVAAYRGQWDWSIVRRLLPSALVGVIIGTILLTTLPGDVVRRLIGLLTLLLVTYRVASNRFLHGDYTPRPWHGWLGGGGSGFASALANSGAPFGMSYLLLLNLTPTVFVATITLLFALINLLKIPGYLTTGIMTWDMVVSVAWTLPLIPLGVWVGKRIVTRINRERYEQFILVVLLLVGLYLLLGTPPPVE